jgi:hypothetical protein
VHRVPQLQHLLVVLQRPWLQQLPRLLGHLELHGRGQLLLQPAEHEHVHRAGRVRVERGHQHLLGDGVDVHVLRHDGDVRRAERLRLDEHLQRHPLVVRHPQHRSDDLRHAARLHVVDGLGALQRNPHAVRDAHGDDLLDPDGLPAPMTQENPMKTTFVFLCGLLALAASSCGGDSKCSSAAGCGGDIAGSWKITSSCITVDAGGMDFNMDCPGATAQASGFSISGTATYGTDGTYSAMTTMTGSIIVNLPATCLMSGGLTLTCAQLTAVLQSDLANSDYQSAVCNGSGGCSCVLTLKPTSSTTTGTYTTSGSVLTETETGGTPDQSTYCVNGTSLTLSPSAMAQMSSGVSGTITLTKQ